MAKFQILLGGQRVYQIKITLVGGQPPIWRRLVLAEDTTLGTLHEIIQRAMGWHNRHMHLFHVNGRLYGIPRIELYQTVEDESKVSLGGLALREKKKYRYEYDFGDDWRHEILVEKIVPADPQVRYPTCVKGKRACPPEDCGGIWGYAALLETLADPTAPDHKELRGWVGGKFDPEAFDLPAINARLAALT